jgi:hypothetical protein
MTRIFRTAGITSDGGEDGRPLRAKAAPRPDVFLAAEHEVGLSELGPRRFSAASSGSYIADGGRTWRSAR